MTTSSLSYKVPFIYMCPNVVEGSYSNLAGTPFFSSLKASYMIDVEYPLTLSGRMSSALTDLLGITFTEWVYIPR